MCLYSCPCHPAHQQRLFCAALHFHLWPLSLYHFLPHYLMNGIIFVKHFLDIKRVFGFSLQILSEIFIIVRRIQQDIIINLYTIQQDIIINLYTIQQDIIINLYTSSCKLLLFLSEFNKNWIFCTDFLNILNPPGGSRVLPRGQTNKRARQS